jgi:hypothetical protein
MSKTNLDHEQTGSGRTRGIRRAQRSDQHQLDSDRSGLARSASSNGGGEPQRADRAVRPGVSQFRTRGAIAGGILRQLIAKADSQLARVEDQLSQLETTRQRLEQEREESRQERQQLQALLENLQQAAQETPK